MFVFADSPRGDGNGRPKDESLGQSFLLLTANVKEPTESSTGAGGNFCRLLEQVASSFNLAKALLNVSRNRGAAGVDGQSVKDVVDAAQQLVPQLQRDLLSGRYRPGDIRRVWIPKPGGGQRGLGIPNVIDRWVHFVIDPASWSEGDWNADGEFNSADLVAALADGGYEQGPRMTTAAVPEPTTLATLVVGLFAAAFLPRSRRKRS